MSKDTVDEPCNNLNISGKMGIYREWEEVWECGAQE